MPTWNGRISPVFDVARDAVVVDIDDGIVVGRDKVAIGGSDVAVKARILLELDINVLICGAISLALEEMLTASEITVISQTRGSTENVLEAYLSGRLTAESFLMPGCNGHRLNAHKQATDAKTQDG